MPDYTAGKARILLEPTARGFFIKSKAALRDDAGGKKLSQDVQLRPVATRFREDADAHLRSLRKLYYNVDLRPRISASLFRSEAKAMAETQLRGLYAKMTVRGMVDMTYANNQLRAWRLKEEARPLRIKVITEHVGGVGRPGGAAAARQMERPLNPDRTFMFGHDVPIIKPKVDGAEAERGMKQLKDRVESPRSQPKVRPHVDVSQSELDKAVKQIQDAFERATTPRRRFGPSIRGVELLQPAMIGIASQAAPALVAALGEVVGAIDQLSGAALAAPGALAVLGTSLATMALGVHGIKDAWKALTQQQQQSQNQETTGALAFERSQNQMRHALVEQQKAQEDLTKARKDARRELEDLHAEERSSYLSVAEAALDLQKARNELAKPAEGPLDYNEKVIAELKARESLSQAIKRQNRDRQDTAEADRKGVENSDRVRQAQEALAQSNEQVAETLKQIQMQSSGAANAADKVKAAMADLSPNAAELTQTLFDLKDKALTPLAKAASQPMFAGVSKSIKDLVNADMPLLTNGVARVAQGINRNLLTFGAALNTDRNRGVLDRIFGNTAEFHKRINAAIDPAVRALGTLTARGTDVMPRLATQFAHVTDKFANFIDKADREGRLDKWIDKGIDGIESLAKSFGRILSTMHSIGQAFGGGRGLIGWIERATTKMDAFFKSGRGQNDLLQVIHMVRQDFEEWKPLLQDLPTLFGAAMLGARTAMGGVLPILNVITSLLHEFPGLTTVAAAGFIGWRTITPILEVTGGLLRGVHAGLVQIPGVARIVGPSMNKVADEAALMSGGVVASTNRVKTGFMSLPGAANRSFERMRAAVQTGTRNTVSAVTQGLMTAVQFVSGPWGSRMTSAASTTMGRFGGTMRNLGTKAVTGFSGALTGLTSFLSGPWGAAIGAAVIALLPFIEKNHDAAEATDANRAAQDRLADSLDRVTQSAGAATRAQVSKELESYTPEHGLQGSPRKGAEAMGVDRDRLLRAVLPGGADDAKKIYQQARESLRQPILDAAGKGVTETLGKQGFSEDDLVDAYLGDESKLSRLREILGGNRWTVDSLVAGVSSFNLTEIDKRLSESQRQQAVVPQYLSHTVPNLQRAQENARQAQRTATGGEPTLTPDAAGLFGSGARPSYDGAEGRVEVPGDFRATHKDDYERLKARGFQFDFDAFENRTSITVPSDDLQQIMVVPTPPSREQGGPSPTLGQRGPTGGIISELHPSEWVLPKEARRRLGDDWLWEQTRNKSVARNHSYELGGPMMPPLMPPPSPLPLAPPTPQPGPGPGTSPAPDPNAVAPGGQGTGPRPGPAPGMPNDDPALGSPPVNTGRVPDGATPDEAAAINAPGPTVDANGNVTSPQSKLPSFGSSLANAFLAPWGFKTDPASGQVVSSQPAGQSGNMSPEAYLGKWAGGFGVSLGETLLNGVAGFFGFNIDNPYFQAFKQTVGFYSGKLGQQADQYVDPQTQRIVGGQVSGYQTLVDPATGTTYLVPNGGTDSELPDIGDAANLPAGHAPEAGLQPNAIKANRAITAAFPEITNIGGVRSDKLKWHPEGLALDVMIPGAGGLNDPTPPKAKALGDRIWAWLGQHAPELGVDMNASLWQKPDHYNHIHVAVYGKDNPAPAGAEAPSAGEGAPHTAGANTDAEQVTVRDKSGKEFQTTKGAMKSHPDWRMVSGGSAEGANDDPGGEAPADTGPPPLFPSHPNAPAAPTAPAAPSAPAAPPAPPSHAGSGHAHADPDVSGRGGGLAGPTAGNSNSLFGGGGNGRVIVLSADSPIAQAVTGRRSHNVRRGMEGLGNEPHHNKSDIAHYIYNAALSRGYTPSEALAITAYSEGESGLDPGISGGAQGAGGSAGTDADVVIGLFQEKAGFAKAGGVDPSSRYTVRGNVAAYLNQLSRHRGQGDIYDQLLATSVGGPMYTGGRGAMAGLEEQVKILLGMDTKQAMRMNGARHYQYGGLVKQGVTVMHHDDPRPDIVVPYADAAKAVEHLQDKAQKAPPDAQHMQPRMADQPPPEVNIPRALPPPGPQATPPPPEVQPQILPPAPAREAAAAPTPGPSSDKSYEHPGVKQAVTSGATTLGNIAATAAAGLSGGMGGMAGPLIQGLFQQGGKIVNDAINVGSAFMSGFIGPGAHASTPNPYGVMQRRQDSPPPLAQDNRRVHQGDNYFASMDEWRRQNQVQDAQDMQAGMARIK